VLDHDDGVALLAEAMQHVGIKGTDFFTGHSVTRSFRGTYQGLFDWLYAEVFADFQCKNVLDLAAPWHG
jgi:hypothetical protein